MSDSGRILPKLTGVIASSNPLRAGEPNILFHAESNTWGDKDSPQKVFQHIAVCMDRCEVLVETLSRLTDCNDFARRTIASYLVLELHGLFTILQGGGRSPLTLPEGTTSVRAVRRAVSNLLNGSSSFARLRNKLIAHLDGNLDVVTMHDLWQEITRTTVAAWMKLVEDYLHALAPHFRDEVTTHLRMRLEPMPGLVARADSVADTYTPYDT
jgi:hypothetical protein